MGVLHQPVENAPEQRPAFRGATASGGFLSLHTLRPASLPSRAPWR
jgi:hypothetical protein